MRLKVFTAFSGYDSHFAAGNSIAVSCMEHIFENLFYPKEGMSVEADGQLALF